MIRGAERAAFEITAAGGTFGRYATGLTHGGVDV